MALAPAVRNAHIAGYREALADVFHAIDREVGTVDQLIGGLTWIGDNTNDPTLRNDAARLVNYVTMTRAADALDHLAALAAAARTEPVGEVAEVIADIDAITGRA